jgi:predicted permease
MEYFKKITSATDPSSSMRWVLIFVTIFTTVLFWGTWLIVCILNNQLTDIPSGAVTAYSAGNASAIFGKVVQKVFGEKDVVMKEDGAGK